VRAGSQKKKAALGYNRLRAAVTCTNLHSLKSDLRYKFTTPPTASEVVEEARQSAPSMWSMAAGRNLIHVDEVLYRWCRRSRRCHAPAVSTSTSVGRLRSCSCEAAARALIVVVGIARTRIGSSSESAYGL